MNTGADIAIWALTPHGVFLSKKLMAHFSGADLFVSEHLDVPWGTKTFTRLGDAVADQFHAYGAHIFIMAAGIAVRVIAPHIRKKTTDPAVVVIDDAGRFCISLLSGHLGGANRLSESAARVINAVPVITTATDANDLPSMDMIARDQNLEIENPSAVKTINMMFLKNTPVFMHDPYGLLAGKIPARLIRKNAPGNPNTPSIIVDDQTRTTGRHDLALRPRILFAGIGCNRGTEMSEISGLLKTVCDKHGLSIHSIRAIATIDLKKDEPGILELAQRLCVPLYFYDSDTLNQVSPVSEVSPFAEKYTGAKSVCEAAAILSATPGKLIVTKQKTRQVTIAIARTTISCSSSGSAREIRTI
jgi:cobalt-precorrin 5A hydrolase